jgi:hypothetical protein
LLFFFTEKISFKAWIDYKILFWERNTVTSEPHHKKPERRGDSRVPGMIQWFVFWAGNLQRVSSSTLPVNVLLHICAARGQFAALHGSSCGLLLCNWCWRLARVGGCPRIWTPFATCADNYFLAKTQFSCYLGQRCAAFGFSLILLAAACHPLSSRQHCCSKMNKRRLFRNT